MLNRSQIKQDVKAFIKSRWFMAFLAMLLTGAVISYVARYAYLIPYLAMMIPIISMAASGSYASDLSANLAILSVIPTLYLLLMLVMVAAMPLSVSLASYFLRLARGENPHIDDVFIPIKGRYFTYLGTALWKALWIWIWSWLFLIPAIIKGIAYSFTYYIISENPKIGALRALKLSMAITKGHKWELFVLYLSFIGWYLLCIVTLGIFSAYVSPFVSTTYAVYYEKLKESAIAEGKVDPGEFYVTAQ